MASKTKITGRDLIKIGFKEGRAIGIALDTMEKLYKSKSKHFKLNLLKSILDKPEGFSYDQDMKSLIHALTYKPREGMEFGLRESAPTYPVYGEQHIEQGALDQMDMAMRLPITIAGALMPDAHHGYGLPIGGVLATENAVVPYGVGVDIGCRMCLSLFDLQPSYFEKNAKEMKRVLVENTKFGGSGEFKKPMDHKVLSRSEFNDIALVKGLKDKAYKQLGTSGSGNHFVEWGIVEILDIENELKVAPGKYVALLSHSGSRGLGATIAGYYTKIAKEKTKLPPLAQQLAWLDLDSQEGQEYWLAMNLAGDYASACHHQIHERIAKAMNLEKLAMVENHHNFAWKEKMADGREVIVHRKGATPAGKGMLGIIPGSMASTGFIVSGKGNDVSINSASHGAGRLMSRTKAKQNITQKEVTQILEKHGVSLIGGGLDEAPMAYKDIHTVMKLQEDLVEVVGTFTPKIVRMDGN
jgi:tRNA-splicing ligase RtcB (3'-phosphate/5'-hydroxy nucleic acid ligase)